MMDAVIVEITSIKPITTSAQYDRGDPAISPDPMAKATNSGTRTLYPETQPVSQFLGLLAGWSKRRDEHTYAHCGHGEPNANEQQRQYECSHTQCLPITTAKTEHAKMMQPSAM
jgi:hypothetical protein